MYHTVKIPEELQEPYLRLYCGKAGVVHWNGMPSVGGGLSFDNAFPEPVEIIVRPIVVNQKEEEMSTHTINIAAIEQKPGRTETEYQRKYLLGELDVAYLKHKETLAKAHGLMEDDPPKTWKELMKRIEGGHFRYDGSKNEDHEHYSALSHLRWMQKDKKEDKEGYKLAKQSLKAAYAKAKDAIIVLDLPTALAAKQEFDALH